MDITNNNIESFVSSLKTPNTIKVVTALFQSIGDVDITHYDSIQMEQLMLALNPNSPKAIITNSYLIGLYAKWLYENGIVSDDNLYQIIQSMDKDILWKKAKPNAPKKFISNSQYNEVLHDIGVYEEYNSLYYQSLFQCVYEGIYNDDLSVIKNLRSRDIKGNIVTLREDNGHSYELEIPLNLAEDLKELSDKEKWDRRGRFGTISMKLKGVYSDSCFKIEDRKNSRESILDSYRFSYYGKLRKIAKEYLEYNLLPLQLYVSGIMHRIRINLNENNITLEDAFAKHSRNRLVKNIISQELIRCNNNIPVRNFREMVKGHLEVFS